MLTPDILPLNFVRKPPAVFGIIGYNIPVTGSRSAIAGIIVFNNISPPGWICFSANKVNRIKTFIYTAQITINNCIIPAYIVYRVIFFIVWCSSAIDTIAFIFPLSCFVVAYYKSLIVPRFRPLLNTAVVPVELVPSKVEERTRTEP